MTTTVTCRTKACRAMIWREDAVAARKVLSDPKARGWYCRRCAEYWKGWRRKGRILP